MEFRSLAGFVTMVLVALFALAYGIVSVLQSILEGRV